jgi:hypothetical protein
VAFTGVNFVRCTRHGLQVARKHWPKTGDRFEVRRQALKLRFWDERHLHPRGTLFDHTYESIKALAGLGVYELRLDDEIGGKSNIRLVFFDPPQDWQPIDDWQPVDEEDNPLRMVWVLEVLPKRRDDWTANDITRFRAARHLLAKRCYGR